MASTKHAEPMSVPAVREPIVVLPMQVQFRTNINALRTFLALLSVFLKETALPIYNSLFFPTTEDVKWFCHQVMFTPVPGSLLWIHNVDRLSISFPPDRGSNTVEIVLMSGSNMMSLDKYGAVDADAISTFDGDDIEAVGDYLAERYSWVEGLHRPEEE